MSQLVSDSRGNPLSGRLRKVLSSAWFRLLATLGLFAILGAQLDMSQIIRAVRQFDRSAGMIMICINLLLIFLFAKRWQMIAEHLQFSPPLWRLVQAVWLANFLGQFGPTLLIAETTRFQMLKKQAKKGQLILSQIVDRMSGQVVLFAMVLCSLPFYVFELAPSIANMLLIAFGLCLLAGFVIGYFYRKIWSLTLSGRALKLMAWKNLNGHYAISLAIQAMLVLNFSLAAFGLGIRDQLIPLLLMTPLVFATITLLPITISDWGTREGAAAILLAPTGLDTEKIIAISVVYGLLHLFTVMPAGLLLIYGSKR